MASFIFFFIKLYAQSFKIMLWLFPSAQNQQNNQ